MQYSIGTTYEGKSMAYLKEIAPFVNHIEVSPDSIAVKNNGRTSLQPEALAQLKWVLANTDIQILVHGVGLSIGSYDGYDDTYIDLLDELTREAAVQWHSEHLAYTKVDGENLGTMLALPRTNEVIDMICRRVETIQERYKIPFLLENVITMLPPSACQYSEAAFLNEITSRTGCGLILDVYNLECDAYNFGLDIESFLSELNLSPVAEIHLAGGNIDREYNFKMDIHSQMVEASTLALAEKVLRSEGACVKAITFEILEEFIDRHGAAAIIRQLKQLHTLFNQHEPRVLTNESL
jgi:uncharacterized protein